MVGFYFLSKAFFGKILINVGVVKLPSDKVHRRWAAKLGIPLHIAEIVDKIIDYPPEEANEKWRKKLESEGGIRFSNGGVLVNVSGTWVWGEVSPERISHDLGEKKKVKIRVPTRDPLLAFRHDPLTGEFKPIRYLGSERVVYTYDILLDILRSRFSGKDYEYAVKAAILHHFLDKIAVSLKQYGVIIAQQHPDKIIHDALNRLKEHRIDWMDYDLQGGAMVSRKMEDIYKFLLMNAREVINDVAEWLQKERKSRLIGEALVRRLLQELIEKRYNFFRKVVYFPDRARPLNVPAAAKKIIADLEKGKIVMFSLGSSVTRPYVSQTIEEFVSSLCNEIGKDLGTILDDIIKKRLQEKEREN